MRPLPLEGILSGMSKSDWEIGEGSAWSTFVEKFSAIVSEYVHYGVEQCENVTPRQLKRQFLRRLARHYGAEIIFDDEPRAGLG